LEADSALELLKPRALKHKNQRACLVRTKERIIAFFDECPHKREPLSRGNCTKEGRIVCSLHSYIFDLTTGFEIEGKSGDLELYPIKETRDGIFIGFPERSF
jgi:nitrite reductase/ring-hydroxylating ferredoxin subunit